MSREFGRLAEILVLALLPGAVDMDSNQTKMPYDILWKDIRIDVKVSNPRKSYYFANDSWPDTVGSKAYHWRFHVNMNGKCDMFLCIGLNSEGEVEKVFAIPAGEVKSIGISVSCRKSKYDEYLV